MKHLITFEASPAHSSRSTLHLVARLLQQMEVEPAGVSWSDRHWLLMLHRQPRLTELLGALAAADGIGRVEVQSLPEPEAPPVSTD